MLETEGISEKNTKPQSDCITNSRYLTEAKLVKHASLKDINKKYCIS